MNRRDNKADAPVILLVEDNPADAGLVDEAFKDGKLICDLRLAENGELALDFLRRQGSFPDAPRPDLILLDLNLPRKDGREVLEEIKADPDLQDIPVLVLTTSDSESDVLQAYRLHANCYLTKPVDIDSFLKKIQSIEGFWLTFVRLPTSHGARSAAARRAASIP